MPGVDHEQGVGNAAAFLCVHKSFFGALEHHQRVFATRKQKGGAFKGGGHFAQDEDGFFFQGIKVGIGKVMQKFGFSACVHKISLTYFLACKPHSLAASSSHHQRPARNSSPKLMARVQGAQPMLGKN